MQRPVLRCVLRNCGVRSAHLSVLVKILLVLLILFASNVLCWLFFTRYWYARIRVLGEVRCRGRLFGTAVY